VRYGDVVDLERKTGKGNNEKEMMDWDRLAVGGNGQKRILSESRGTEFTIGLCRLFTF
jgi:hypothetical protein